MKRLITILLVSFMLVACEPPDVAKLMKPDKKVSPSKELETVKRNFNSEQLSRGAVLFQNNCAVCHGEQGEGAENWQKRDKDGKFPPPPLNGTGHTWHHPTKILKYTINNGTGKIGGNMPAFAGKISDTEIDDILIFIQSKWPVPLYDTWYKNNQRSIKEKNK